MYTLPCLKGKSSKALLFGTGGSAQCFLAAWTGGEFGGERTHVCVAESLCCPPEAITTLFIGYTPVQNKKVFCFVFKQGDPLERKHKKKHDY